MPSLGGLIDPEWPIFQLCQWMLREGAGFQKTQLRQAW